jgi:histidinol-phosphatase
MNPAWKDRYLRAIDAAQAAGQHALAYFDRPLAVEWKANETPVTIADKEAEQIIRKRLLEHFPGDGFLGEEYGDQPGGSDFRWIVDPVDGTRNFVRGIPLWGTLVGLEYRGDPIAGVCYIPPLNILYRALRGDGAYRGDRRIRVSDVSEMKQGQAFFSNLTWFKQSSAWNGFLEVLDKMQRTRGYGDFYGFMLVAQGSGDLMLEYGVLPWDIAALVPIVEEAGGAMTDWDGNRTIWRTDTLASNGRLHAAALDILQRNRGPDWMPGETRHQGKIV